MPGVRAVIAGADIVAALGAVPTIPFRRPNPTSAPYAQPVIATRVVRYVGEPVAMVLADAPELAEDAALAVELDIAPLPVVVDRRASAAGDTLLFPGTSGNCAATFTAEAGDAAAAHEAWQSALQVLEDLNHPHAASLRARLKSLADSPG